MPELVFLPKGAVEPLCRVDVQPGDVVLDVARFHEVPLHWRCGQGTCATCVVYLEHAGQPASVTVSAKERNVLARAGLLDASLLAGTVWPDTPQTPRLACHCRVGETDMTVHFHAI